MVFGVIWLVGGAVGVPGVAGFGCTLGLNGQWIVIIFVDCLCVKVWELDNCI